MKDNSNIGLSAVLFLTALFIPVTALANSSWYWLTNARPIYILPVCAAATIAIEYLAVVKYAKTKCRGKAFLWIVVANLASFSLPYILMCFDELYNFRKIIENTPSYTVGIAFLAATLAAEMPIVFFALRKHTQSSSRLITAIIASNAVTMAMVAIVERMICKGSW